jgi:ubiquinone/menaquinone biosynthesis C-methylase UbiE
MPKSRRREEILFIQTNPMQRITFVFSHTQSLYDAIYSWKDYSRDARALRKWIASCGIPEGASLLDVACGTGAHVPHLRFSYDVEGLDLDAGMLKIARERNPGITFHQGDMVDFDLGKKFDIVACLFSSIAYACTPEGMSRAVATMARHLEPKGVLFVEPFVAPYKWNGYTPNAQLVDHPRLKICRMTHSVREGNEVAMTFHYIVSDGEGVRHMTERHDIGLFDHSDYSRAFAAAGLTTAHEKEGLMGRGLYIARFVS